MELTAYWGYRLELRKEGVSMSKAAESKGTVTYKGVGLDDGCKEDCWDCRWELGYIYIYINKT